MKIGKDATRDEEATERYLEEASKDEAVSAASLPIISTGVEGRPETGRAQYLHIDPSVRAALGQLAVDRHRRHERPGQLDCGRY